NVVPMVVGHEDVCFGIAFSCARRGPSAAEHAQPGAAIQYKLSAVGRDELETGRVAAIAPGRGIHGRSGAAHSPEAELGHGTPGRIFFGTAHHVLSDAPATLGACSSSYAKGQHKMQQEAEIAQLS